MNLTHQESISYFQLRLLLIIAFILYRGRTIELGEKLKSADEGIQRLFREISDDTQRL